MPEMGNSDDDTSFEWMSLIGQNSGRGGNVSRWIANDAGLGVEYFVVTSAGDRLIWSS
jgi:hypothetical protein